MFDGLFEFTALEEDIHDSNSNDSGGICGAKIDSKEENINVPKNGLNLNDLTDTLTDFERPDGDGQSKYFELLDNQYAGISKQAVTIILRLNRTTMRIITDSDRNTRVQLFLRLIKLNSSHSVDVISLKKHLMSWVYANLSVESNLKGINIFSDEKLLVFVML